MARIFIVALCIGLGACTTSPVKLWNVATGQTATCGPYYIDGIGSNAQAQREAQCINDFERQGFVRAAD